MIKPGAACKKVNQKVTSGVTTFVCAKKGKRLIWTKVVRPISVPTATTTPTPEPTPPPPPNAPTSLEDLYEHRAGVSWAAWSVTVKNIHNSVGRTTKLEIYNGPTTKPYYDNYPLVSDLVSRAFPNSPIPPRFVVIRYNFQDQQWAKELMRSLVSQKDYDQIERDQARGALITSNCYDNDCRGASRVGLRSDVSFILRGVPAKLSGLELYRATSGQIDVHEFFHGLQFQVEYGKPNGFEAWRLRWLLEGGAEWAQNAVMHYGSYEKYLDFLKRDCQDTCRQISESQAREYLELAEDAGDKYEQWLDYNLGSRFIEVLVALKGPEVTLQIQSLMADGATFAAAFQRIFNVDWATALPIIAKTVAANIAEGR